MYELVLKNYASGAVFRIALRHRNKEMLQIMARKRNERERRQHRNTRWAVRSART